MFIFNSDEQLRTLCIKLASDPLLVQGAGGNISAKEGDLLWIKASGTWLSEAGEKDIFIPLSKSEVDTYIANRQFDALPKSLDGSDLRPSIETWLHALMPQKFVVHLHALDILALLIHESSEAELESLYADDETWGFVSYEKPGPALALAVANVMASRSNLQVLFLENHGIVIAADSIQEIHELLSSARDKAGQKIKQKSMKSAISQPLIGEYRPVADVEIHSLATSETLLQLVRRAWAISPDHVVFLGGEPAIVDSLSVLETLGSMGDNAPLIVFVKGVGVYSNKELDLAGQQQLRAYFEILIRQRSDEVFSTFNDSQIGELINWDAEKYRLAMRK
jgi:rhamnose utilization protein RhaD (predicted bifunctional aldolase and dehydrogenase)